MHSVQVHQGISLMISIFYGMGLWHRGDKPTIGEMRIKLFYSTYYSLFALSLAAGIFKSKRLEEAIFLVEVSIAAAVLAVKFWFLIWKQSEILNLLERVCGFSIQNDDDHKRFTDKLRDFMKFAFVFVIVVTVVACLESGGATFFGSEKRLFFKIGFPLDYENSEIAFWIAFAFVLTESFLSMMAIVFSVVIWYLLFICSLRYEVLGSELKKMGTVCENGGEGMTETQRHNQFSKDLKTSADSHLHLKEVINEVDASFSDLFLIQFATSGLCICGSVYCLAFDIGDSVLERLTYLLELVYFISEVFMITYFGNEIMLSSDRLSYSLFESDWYSQPQSTKKNIIIFGEYLKRPHELVIGKLYPLTLATFTRILNSAYSMFNILKNFQ